MFKRAILSWSIFLIIINLIFGSEINLEERFTISQEKAILMNIQCFAVTEDEMFILPDAKAGDIKLYDNEGKLIKIWGRRGPGPDEFGSPFFCDYKNSTYIHLDAGKNTISIYKRIEPLKFARLHELLCPGCLSDVRLFKDGVLIDSYAIDSNGNEFSLYFKNFEGEKTHHILPLYLKYGFESENQYKTNFNDISPIGVFAYFSIWDNFIFYVWEGRLKILKINLGTKRIEAFGQETKNYIRPKVTRGILEARRKRKGEIESKEKEKMSWIRGVNANKNIIFLYYVNFNKEMSLWEAFLQFYDHAGKLLHEQRLNEAVSYLRYGPPLFYSQSNNRIYLLSRRLNEENYLDEYEVLKYKIDK